MSDSNLLRRAHLRGLKEGPVQTVRVEVFDTNGREDVERWQDYGFAAAPVEGQGLIIEVGGHTVVLRMDRIDGRPQLNANEVAVWHKDGHKILMTDGGKIRIECDDLEVVTKKMTFTATDSASFETPKVDFSADIDVGGRADITEGASIQGHEFMDHEHDQVVRGDEQSGGVV